MRARRPKRNRKQKKNEGEGALERDGTTGRSRSRAVVSVREDGCDVDEVDVLERAWVPAGLVVEDAVALSLGRFLTTKAGLGLLALPPRELRLWRLELRLELSNSEPVRLEPRWVELVELARLMPREPSRLRVRSRARLRGRSLYSSGRCLG